MAHPRLLRNAIGYHLRRDLIDHQRLAFHLVAHGVEGLLGLSILDQLDRKERTRPRTSPIETCLSLRTSSFWRTCGSNSAARSTSFRRCTSASSPLPSLMPTCQVWEFRAFPGPLGAPEPAPSLPKGPDSETWDDCPLFHRIPCPIGRWSRFWGSPIPFHVELLAFTCRHARLHSVLWDIPFSGHWPARVTFPL